MLERPSVERFAGCLVGLAVGDALAMPAAGATRHEIHARWGRISDFQAGANLAPGQYTARTQTMIALAESVISARGFDAQAARRGLLEWWRRSDARRPDAGTREACERLAAGAAQDAASDSADSGAAARAVVVGLLHCRRSEALLRDAAAAARITHRDPRAIAAALTMAAAAAHLVAAPTPLDRSEFIEQAAAAAAGQSAQLALAIRGVADLFDMAPRAAMRELGSTGFALEAVPAALYCFAAAPEDFAEAALLAVNSGGDCDTIAALTGALGGAYLGVAGIPQPWVEGVEGSQRLRQLARELHALA